MNEHIKTETIKNGKIIFNDTKAVSSQVKLPRPTKPRKQKTKKASTKDNLFSFGHKFVVTPEHRSGVLLRVIKHIFKLKQTARVSEKC